MLIQVSKRKAKYTERITSIKINILPITSLKGESANTMAFPIGPKIADTKEEKASNRKTIR